MIFHGNALDVLRGLGSGSVDGVLADPPYSSGGAMRGDRTAKTTAKYRGWSQNPDGSSKAPETALPEFGGDTRDQRGYGYWSALWLSEALRVTRPGGVAMVFTDWRQLPTVTDAIQAGGWVWRGILVWDKGIGRPMKGRPRNHVEYVVWGSNGPMNGDANPIYMDSVFRFPPPKSSARHHLTEKPVDLLVALMKLVPGQTVLDPFMGSGTTLVAAKRCGRDGIGIEIDERFCDVARDRLAAEPEQLAVVA